MVLRKEDCGLVEFVIENSGSGMTATAALTTEPEDLERLIKFLIVAHNRHVDSGLVDALKFTSTLFE
ncbi:hypothetical protein [Streptosporangium canum]|nr:hypothetical protein [Streptosporangium canum]